MAVADRVGSVAPLAVGPADDGTRVTEEIADRVHRRVRVVVGAGRAVDRVGEVGRTLRESLHVVDAVRQGTRQRTVHRLEDVHLRGLLSVLADDDRLRLFAARELDALAEHDARWRTGLLDTVRALVRHPGSKLGLPDRSRPPRCGTGTRCAGRPR